MTHQANRPAGAPRIKGWCPGAWRPMASGDGLLVRVRPPLGRLSRHQMLALCEAAETFGSGLIELTNRANLQLRGVSDASWPGLMAFLVEHGLVAADPQDERRLPLLLTPDWQPGDVTHEVVRRLEARLDALPALPAKMGVAIDAGEAPLLGEVSADLRIERSVEGTLLVRADGRALGTPVDSPVAAVELLIRLLRWFVDSGGHDAGRMRRHPAPLPPWAPATRRPAAAGCVPALGQHAWGRALGLPFGRAPAATLRVAVIAGSVGGVRVTPWRRLLVEGFPTGEPSPPGLLESESDPRLAMQACPGAPYCEQASVATLGLAQELAERLGGQLAGSVHLSGCAKGCACQAPADLCLTGREGRFDLIVGGRADGTPVVTGLNESDVIEYLEKKNDASRL